MKKHMKFIPKIFGKNWWWKLPLMTVIVTIVALILNFALGFISIAGAYATGATLIISAILLGYVLHMHKGEENLVYILPRLMFVVGLGSILVTLIGTISGFTWATFDVAFSLQGLGVALMAFFIAEVIVTKIKK